jgi:hypothetical protein
MRWPPWRHRVVDGGEKALEDAKRELARVRAQDREVKRVADELRQHRRSNHLTEKIESLFRVGGTP